MSKILKADGETVALIKFDPSKVASLRREQQEHLAYHIGRLLRGEGTAENEWRHLGLEIALRAPRDGLR